VKTISLVLAADVVGRPFWRTWCRGRRAVHREGVHARPPGSVALVVSTRFSACLAAMAAYDSRSRRLPERGGRRHVGHELPLHRILEGLAQLVQIGLALGIRPRRPMRLVHFTACLRSLVVMVPAGRSRPWAECRISPSSRRDEEVAMPSRPQYRGLMPMWVARDEEAPSRGSFRSRRRRCR